MMQEGGKREQPRHLQREGGRVNSEVISLSHHVQGQNEDILKIVGRAVLTLHLHGETLSSDKVSSMIACYAEEEPVSDDENQRLYALAIQMLS
ncbi:hypothetical protein [Pantoea sp. USHLN256]|uniref:hypothetical protein n=1 Tax=Pantoea sp. USHLN256 TaxID=3081293 RepID=UPI00301B4DD4